MKLVTFSHDGRTRIGAVEGTEVVDLSTHGGSLQLDMLAFLEQGQTAMDAARAACASGTGRLALANVRLEAPIRRPPKILAVGLNYRDHVEETGGKIPEVPMIFNKQATAVIGPRDAIHRPKDSEQLDYEGELGIVIGKRCRRVPKDKAPGVIAGYTIVNDVSVRDWQFRSATTTMGKSWDTHCPMGPLQYQKSDFQLLRYHRASFDCVYPGTGRCHCHRHPERCGIGHGAQGLVTGR
jgi:2-keto-4-pentenoate hydratase/2-oxohepta-3-ene-1,7-dioic acid hydratase in catechol pathway